MQRTTIMLQETLKSRALRHAEMQRISLGEFIRRSLALSIRQPQARQMRDPLFADAAVFRGSVPRDLSRHHDRYLYGESAS